MALTVVRPGDRPTLCRRRGKALAEEIGAVTVDGKMIDVPIVERARLLPEREAAIVARERRMIEMSTAAS